MARGTLSVQVRGADRVMRKLRAASEEIRDEVTRAMHKAALEVEREAKQRVEAVDTGRLRASISTTAGDLEATVRVASEYGVYVEFGSKPHWPPISALEGWARRHGIGEDPRQGAFLVARKISQVGTKPRPFFVPAWEAKRRDAERDVRHAIDEAVRQMGRGA